MSEPEEYKITCTITEIQSPREDGRTQSDQKLNIVPDRPVPSRLMTSLAIYICHMTAMESDQGYEKSLETIQKGLASMRVRKKPKDNEPGQQS